MLSGTEMAEKNVHGMKKEVGELNLEQTGVTEDEVDLKANAESSWCLHKLI